MEAKMSESNPNETKSPGDDIGDQLNELGRNLRDALRTAWESDERRKLQQEIEVGLTNLRDSLNEAAKDFSNSQTGQNLKEDVKDLHERWQTGDVGSKVRSEIAEALRTVNRELHNASQKNQPPPSDKKQE
jgi:signal recognition particle GTPase